MALVLLHAMQSSSRFRVSWDGLTLVYSSSSTHFREVDQTVVVSVAIADAAAPSIAQDQSLEQNIPQFPGNH